jgi:hypothetical protein
MTLQIIDLFERIKPRGLALSGPSQHDWSDELSTGTINLRMPEFTNSELNTKIDNTFKVYTELLTSNFGLVFNFVDLKIKPSSTGGFVNEFNLYAYTGEDFDSKPIIKKNLSISISVQHHSDEISCKFSFHEKMPSDSQALAIRIFQNVSEANDLKISLAA